MKEFLEKLIAEKRSKLNEILKRMDESNDLNDVKALAAKIDEIKSEIAEIEAQIAKLKEEEPKQEPDANPEPPKNGNDRSRFNPIATYRNTNGQSVQSRSFGRDSMEYRKAFMKFVQTGEKSDILISESRSGDAYTVTTDLGILLPETIEQKVYTGITKRYGKLLEQVDVRNVKGVLKLAIGLDDVTVSHGDETLVPDAQKIAVKGYVTIGYNKIVALWGKTELEDILSVEAFETAVTNKLIAAIKKDIDSQIVAGRGSANNEFNGILTEAAAVSSRIPSANVIEMTAADVADWTKWQTEFFAKLDPDYIERTDAKFLFTSDTWESNIRTLHDNNNHPVYEEKFNTVTGEEIRKFHGFGVDLIGSDLTINSVGFEGFDSASDGDYFGMLWVPYESYIVNFNQPLAISQFDDKKTDKVYTKAKAYADGNVKDGGFIYLLKKDV
jgi:HK97 family phage major capsid protein